MTATMQGALCVNSSEAVAKRDFPFSREENPLASQLIFLAEVVGAKIAAAAASAAMQELFEKGIKSFCTVLQSLRGCLFLPRSPLLPVLLPLVQFLAHSLLLTRMLQPQWMWIPPLRQQQAVLQMAR
jgi:hypothetical protein